MPSLTFQFDQRVTRVGIDAAILTAGRLNICLLQLPLVPDGIDGDDGRPTAVNAVRDLLLGGPAHTEPALLHMLPGVDPTVIVAPEYAFGSGDWPAIDAIVRATTRPIVLLAGFGATPGQVILDWRAAQIEGGTVRHFSWEQESAPISPPRRVNGGWCWIHEPGGTTHCIVQLKNVLEQAVEAVKFADLQAGTTIIQLAFADVDLFPLICADLLQPAVQDPASPQGRIRQMLAYVPVKRPALVVGSLLQPGFNVNWAIAIDSLLNTVLAGRPGVVALCNIAHDHPLADEERDKWRSLSGVYAPFAQLPKGQDNLPAARALNAQGIAGAVVRHTHPCVTSGTVAWPPYNPVNGRFVWHGEMTCPVFSGGLTSPISIAPKSAACEIGRFTRRHPPAQGCAPRLAVGLKLLDAHLVSAAAPTPNALLDMTLEGVDVRKRHDPDDLHGAMVVSAFQVGIHALATMKAIEGINWQESAGLTGQLRIDAQRRHLLVWRSPYKSSREMQRDLAAWRLLPGQHPDLIVLGAGPTGDLADGEIVESRRDDISLAPSSDVQLAGGSLAAVGSDFTTVRARRRVAGIGLSRIAEVYTDYEADAEANQIAKLLTQIGAFFPEESAE